MHNLACLSETCGGVALIMNLAFCGPPGAGKTAAAIYIVKKHGYHWRSFAADLKYVCSFRAEAGWREKLHYWMEEKLVTLYGYYVAYQIYEILCDKMASCRWINGGKNRAMLQLVGNAARDIIPDIWIDIALDNLPEPCVIDDLRYPNELTALRKRGFVFYRITAPEDMRIERLRKRDGDVDLEALKSPAEHALDDVELPEYENIGAIENLYRWCGTILNAC